jgi:hypothetical protein
LCVRVALINPPHPHSAPITPNETMEKLFFFLFFFKPIFKEIPLCFTIALFCVGKVLWSFALTPEPPGRD